MSITRYDPTWTLKEALKYIREQQPIFHSMNFHLALAGSVLNKGISDNDLDIIIMEMHNDKEPNFENLFAHMHNIGAARLLAKETEEYQLNGRVLYRSLIGDKVIDWFIYGIDEGIEEESDAL